MNAARAGNSKVRTQAASRSESRKVPGTARKRAANPVSMTSRETLTEDVAAALKWLKARRSKAAIDGMSRYGIPSQNALGVAMRDMIALGRQLGRNQELALALWDTGIYEARMVVSFVADPDRVTSLQMDRWCKQFDNWAICDTMCFHFFDRTPYAWEKVRQWSRRKGEFEKRTAFALLWSLTVHDKHAGDAAFLEGLEMIEREAPDDRHWVKKAVNMALRATGKRNAALNAAAVATARRLAASPAPAAQWVGKDALRELTSSSVRKRI